ncbi:hypothetical protein [Streptococcus uberis]|uniref:hypothetical protein n=1 Tax=Streptococcus uberis TaxID=1349 RepID=UPI00214FB93C|nr:hypothetical protein [Streptococcus uberis]MCR4258241.1 hypothetical protein [Streptococcus uberis]MCV6815285.1 hypothetical protein [Streptococcus uberis]MCZ8475552.1 hypothetical protein [Streptococcus uberis]
MSKFKVNHNFVFEDRGYDKDVVTDMTVSEAKRINEAGKNSHPDLYPLLTEVDTKKAEAEK